MPFIPGGHLTIVTGSRLLVVVDQRADEPELGDCACEFLSGDGRVVHGERGERPEPERVVRDLARELVIHRYGHGRRVRWVRNALDARRRAGQDHLQSVGFNEYAIGRVFMDANTYEVYSRRVHIGETLVVYV